MAGLFWKICMPLLKIYFSMEKKKKEKNFAAGNWLSLFLDGQNCHWNTTSDTIDYCSFSSFSCNEVLTDQETSTEHAQI